MRGIAVFPVQWRGRSLGAILLRKRSPGIQHVGAARRRARQADREHHRRAPSPRRRAREPARPDAPHLARALRGRAPPARHRLAQGALRGRRRRRGRPRRRRPHPVRQPRGRADHRLRARRPARQRARRSRRRRAARADRRRDRRACSPASTSTRSTSSCRRRRGSPVWVSASTSTVLAGTGAVILAFRDVTAERALEHELRSTKEFLERLIDSTVDAIIAADMRGPDHPVQPGRRAAVRLSRARRDRQAAGVGALRGRRRASRSCACCARRRTAASAGSSRRAARSASRPARSCPVSMTASIVYEGEREVATVGILTDLRERIRMEQRLLDAQQKLQLSEKQALVAELAGAAAHELNQPLTSIMGYAQLIERQSDRRTRAAPARRRSHPRPRPSAWRASSRRSARSRSTRRPTTSAARACSTSIAPRADSATPAIPDRADRRRGEPDRRVHGGRAAAPIVVRDDAVAICRSRRATRSKAVTS